jgi:hypothetical protein
MMHSLIAVGSGGGGGNRCDWIGGLVRTIERLEAEHVSYWQEQSLGYTLGGPQTKLAEPSKSE